MMVFIVLYVMVTAAAQIALYTESQEKGESYRDVFPRAEGGVTGQIANLVACVAMVLTTPIFVLAYVISTISKLEDWIDGHPTWAQQRKANLQDRAQRDLRDDY